MDELILQKIEQLDHSDLYNFYRFYQKYLIAVLRLGKPQRKSDDELEQAVLTLDTHNKLYKFDKWFKSFVREKGLK